MEIEVDQQTEIQTVIRKYKVIVMNSEGHTYKEIEEQTSFQRGTISKLIKKFEEFGDVLYDRRISNQRPSKMTEESKQMIEESLNQNNRVTIKQLQTIIADECGQVLSKGTINNYEQEIGKFKLPQIVPILSHKNQQLRLEYSLNHQHDKFSNVIFSDESSFQVFRQTKKVFVMKGEFPQQIGKPNPNFSVMVWGAICRKGKIELQILEKNVNQYTYLDLLKEIPDQATRLFGTSWRFQQDNAPAHRALSVKNWMDNNFYKTLKHPPQSPDLNPIEMIWGWMKSQIENHLPQNKQQLKDLIIKYWNDITIQQINNCIDHLIKNIQQVIELEGEFINK